VFANPAASRPARIGLVRPDEHHEIAHSRGLLAEAAVLGLLLVAELDHPRGHEETALGGMRGEHVEGGGRALGVRVVRVVDHDHTGGGVHDRGQPVLGRVDLGERARDLVERQAHLEARRGGRHEVGDVVLAEKPRLHRHRLGVARAQPEHGAALAQLHVLGPHVRVRVRERREEPHLAGGALRGAAAALVVGARDQRTARRDRLGQLALRQLGLVERPEPLEVGRPDRRQDPDPRRGELAQLGHVAAPVGAHLHDERPVARLQPLVDRAHHAEPAVERRGCGIRGPAQLGHGGHAVLGRGLPVRAGDADHQRVDLGEVPAGARDEAAVVGSLDRLDQEVGEDQQLVAEHVQREAERDDDRHRHLPLGEEPRRQEQHAREHQGHAVEPLRARREHERLDLLAAEHAPAARGAREADREADEERKVLTDRGGAGHHRRGGDDAGQLLRHEPLAPPPDPDAQARRLVVLELEQVQQHVEPSREHRDQPERGEVDAEGRHAAATARGWSTRKSLATLAKRAGSSA
jgi:hypothetical protein